MTTLEVTSKAGWIDRVVRHTRRSRKSALELVRKEPKSDKLPDNVILFTGIPGCSTEGGQPSFSDKLIGYGNPPRKTKNLDKRSREYLTGQEVERLVRAARSAGKHGHGLRDSMLILIGYRHAMRVGELVGLQWSQVDFATSKLHVNRLKHGDASVHFLEGDEVRSLRALHREQPDSSFVFCSERKGPMTTRAVFHVVARAGVKAGIEFPVHPHMLRHSKGYQLANKGIDTRAIQAYLGHRNIQHTTVYTQLSAERFRDFGKDC